jgi:hypothetical protein
MLFLQPNHCTSFNQHLIAIIDGSVKVDPSEVRAGKELCSYHEHLLLVKKEGISKQHAELNK